MVCLATMASIRLSSARASSSRPISIGDDFDPHRCAQPRLVVQGAVRPFDGFDRRLGLVAHRVGTSSGHPGVSRVRVERQGAIESRRRHRRLAGQAKQRPGSLRNRFGVAALDFERLSGKAAGLTDVLIRQCSPPVSPLMSPARGEQSPGRGVGRIDRQRLPGEGDRLGKTARDGLSEG
jgi:hypothetical protein